MVWPQEYLHSFTFLLASSRTSLHLLPPILSAPFSSIMATAVYIPPQADTSLALSKLHDVLSGYINKYPDTAFIIAGDFNKANLRKFMPNFQQHVSCPTRGLNTLDHCYALIKNVYKAHSLLAFGKTVHDAIFLSPEYKQSFVQEPRWREKWIWSCWMRAGPPTLKLSYRRLLMTSTGTCSGRVHLTSVSSQM